MSLSALSKVVDVLSVRRGPVLGFVGFASAGLVALTLGLFGTPLGAQTPPSAEIAAATSSFSSAQKRDIESVVRDYLLKNPKLMLEVEAELKKIVATEEAAEMKKAIAKNSDYLFHRADAPIAGNKDGDIPVVEFFDYNCGYCKRSFKDIADLIAKDPKVKVVFMEYPILSKGSLEASKVALAARNQGKYWPVHAALLQHKGGIDGAVAMKIAEAAGLDMVALKKDVESPEIKAELDRVQALAQSMDIQGTPHFLVGDRNIPGAPRDLLDQILKNAAELRKEGCSVC